MMVIDRLRQPEYIGENRCTPCTAVNIIIAAVVSLLISIASTLFGIGVFALSLGTIYLRGYLVPGTPTLTKRYFPERILRWFDKDTTIRTTNGAAEIDPERTLLDADAVEPCCEGADLCLTLDFQNAWRKRIQTTRPQEPAEEHLASALGIVPEDNRITIDQQDNAYLAYTDDGITGQWSSQAAVIADVAAATELSERLPNWSDYTPAKIARVLMSLRIFIEQCPDCGGPVQVEQEVVKSCCRSYDVVASACQDCDARLFEMEWDDTGTNKSSIQPNQSTQTNA